jgi:hypothetical protein
MKQAGYVAHIGEKRNVHKILIKKPEGRDHLEELGINGRISEWTLKEQDGWVWTGFTWFRMKVKTSSSMKCEEFTSTTINF